MHVIIINNITPSIRFQKYPSGTHKSKRMSRIQHWKANFWQPMVVAGKKVDVEQSVKVTHWTSAAQITLCQATTKIKGVIHMKTSTNSPNHQKWKHITTLSMYPSLFRRVSQASSWNKYPFGIQLCDKFHLCGKTAETNKHLALHYEVTTQIWNIFQCIRWYCQKDPSNCWNVGTGEEVFPDKRQMEDFKMIPGCIW